MIPYPCDHIPYGYISTDAISKAVELACPIPPGYHVDPPGTPTAKPYTDSAEWYWRAMGGGLGRWYKWRTFTSDGHAGPVYQENVPTSGEFGEPGPPAGPSTSPNVTTGPLYGTALDATYRLPPGAGGGGIGGSGGSAGGPALTSLPTAGVGMGTTPTESAVTGAPSWAWFAAAALVLWWVAE